MEKAMEPNSSTSPLEATGLLSPSDTAPLYQSLLCRELGGQIIIVSESCSGHAVCSNTKQPLTERPKQGYARCLACRKDTNRGRKQINRVFDSATTETSSTQENVRVIARNPKKAETLNLALSSPCDGMFVYTLLQFFMRFFLSVSFLLAKLISLTDIIDAMVGNSSVIASIRSPKRCSLDIIEVIP